MRLLPLVLALSAVTAACSADGSSSTVPRSADKDATPSRNDDSSGDAPTKDDGTKTTPVTPAGTPATPTAALHGAGFTPITPVRLIDSRDGSGIAPGVFSGTLTPGVEHPIDLRGLDTQLGAAASRAGLALVVTVTDTESDGFLTAYPCGTSPDTSTVNFSQGESISTMAIVATGDSLCLKSIAAVNVVIDAIGAFENGRGARFSPIPTSRAFDSRSGEKATTFKIPITGLPAGATGVAAHVTITEPDGPGFARVYDCGTEPSTSSVNFGANETIGTTVLTALDAEKNLCITSITNTHLVVDIEASFGVGTNGFMPSPASRLFDSRGATGAATEFEIAVPGLPKDATTAAIQLTATEATVDTVVSAHACGTATATSSINIAPGKVRTSAAFVLLNADGHLCVTASAPVQLIADAVGVLAP